MYFRPSKYLQFLTALAVYIPISAVIALLPTLCVADIRLNADWENGVLNDYHFNISKNPYGIEIQDNRIMPTPVCSGNKSLKSTLEYQVGTVWSQVVLNMDPFNSFDIGKRHWFSFAIFLPDEYRPDTAEEIIWELHGRADTADGELWRNAPLAIRTLNDEWVVTYHKDSKYITYTSTDSSKNYEESGRVSGGKFVTGKWTTFVIETLYDYRSQGYVNVWKDGELILNKMNGIGYNDSKGPFVRMGIYKKKWDLSTSWGGPSEVSNRTIYMDDFKIGDANATYNEMLPVCTPIINSLVTTTNIMPPSGLSFSVK